jgi:hypothetical protein
MNFKEFYKKIMRKLKTHGDEISRYAEVREELEIFIISQRIISTWKRLDENCDLKDLENLKKVLYDPKIRDKAIAIEEISFEFEENAEIDPYLVKPWHYSQKLFGTSIGKSVWFRNYKWIINDQSSIRVVQNMIKKVEEFDDILKFYGTNRIDEMDLGVKVRDIAFDYYRINGRYKKVFGENIINEKKQIRCVNLCNFDVGLWFETNCDMMTRELYTKERKGNFMKLRNPNIDWEKIGGTSRPSLPVLGHSAGS